MFKIRIEGTEEDISNYINMLYSDHNIEVIQASKNYRNRGNSEIYRSYIDINIPNKPYVSETINLYTMEDLKPDEEIELINKRISELQLDIEINKTLISADKSNIKFLNKRLKELLEKEE